MSFISVLEFEFVSFTVAVFVTSRLEIKLISVTVVSLSVLPSESSPSSEVSVTLLDSPGLLELTSTELESPAPSIAA